MTGGNQRAIDAFFEGLDEEAQDLAERLVCGDDEAVWAWFHNSVRSHFERPLAVSPAVGVVFSCMQSPGDVMPRHESE